MFWLIPAVAAVIAFGLVLAGGVPLLGAQRELRAAMARVRNSARWLETARPQGTIARIAADVAAMEALLERAREAVRRMQRALSDMRIGDAVAAIRVATIALRALARSVSG